MTIPIGQLRLAAETIHANLKSELPSGYPEVTMSFGRAAAGEHAASPHLKVIPIGGNIAKGSRRAHKVIPGPAGKIEPGPEAKLTQQGVDTRNSECAMREPQIMFICLAGEGEAEGEAIDAAEDLLKRVIVAAFAAYQDEVAIVSERWLLQDEERKSLGVTGEAVALVLSFRFPVLHVTRPVVKLVGFNQTCKLDNTLEDDAPPP